MSSETFSRRNVLVTIASAAAAAASVTQVEAQHVHEAVAEEKTSGPYVPKAFTEHETQTLKLLCETIVPGASQGGAFEYIDLLSSHNPQLKAIYTGGLGWLDHQMQARVQADFIDAKPEARKAMLDTIAYRMNSDAYGPGVRFFDWARKMTVDAYYTSAAGIKDLGYLGNRGTSQFSVPEEAIEYALKRSGLG